MHLLVERLVFWWWSGFSERRSQDLLDGANVASQLAKPFSVFTSIVYESNSVARAYRRSSGSTLNDWLLVFAFYRLLTAHIPPVCVGLALSSLTSNDIACGYVSQICTWIPRIPRQHSSEVSFLVPRHLSTQVVFLRTVMIMLGRDRWVQWLFASSSFWERTFPPSLRTLKW
jgi:hypothetical protein